MSDEGNGQSKTANGSNGDSGDSSNQSTQPTQPTKTPHGPPGEDVNIGLRKVIDRLINRFRRRPSWS